MFWFWCCIWVCLACRVGIEIVDGVGLCVGDGLQATIANRRTTIRAVIALFIILLLLKELPYDLIEGHFSNRFAMH